VEKTEIEEKVEDDWPKSSYFLYVSNAKKRELALWYNSIAEGRNMLGRLTYLNIN
jgi:hypothetical protein